MRTKVTLVLIFLNVALFFFIFRFERAWRTEDALREARRRVLGAETTEIRTLSVTSTTATGASYTMVRQRDVWVLTDPLDWPANQYAAQNIVAQLQLLENETSFAVSDILKSGRSLADYGLDKPRLTVAFTSSAGGAATASGAPAAGPRTVLQIGDSTNMGNRFYVLSPDGSRVHVVGRALIDAISVPLDQLRADALLTIEVFEARALSVQTSGARVRIRRESGSWLFDTIVNARASRIEMDLTIKELNRLRAKSFPPNPPAVLPSSAPTLRVTLDGTNRSETLFLGEPVRPAGGEGAGAAAKETEYYAQLMNGNSVRSPVFTVVVPSGTNSLLERLQQAQTELRERRIVDFDPLAVTSVTLAAPNQPSLTLQRLDPNAPNSTWHLVRESENAGRPQTLAAESVAVRQLLDRLSLLSATRFESDAPSSAQIEAWGFNRPEREITIMTSTAPGAANRPTILQLGTDKAGAVFARVGRPTDPWRSVYAVDVDLGRDFPVDIASWRDRTIRELPATARIAALKLTDLTTQKVVFETTFGPDGAPTVAPRDPTALGKLLPALRTLRAKRFVRDRFVDQMLLAGDDRTWRYQLDLTVALPAGGAEQTSTSTLFLTDRVGGAQQLAGSREFDVVFEVEQPFLDGLWSVGYGARDPGPQEKKP
ncbi:DUF4340 domain-containing protein [Opitutus sp. ER46]|uniref:DUF4340 domain-containing protein n=1 Tax=Opitutus sp. ER46 TaxID=2161864 RepID=UPI000D2FDC18|nr:DUF4340 domain-containing protein [Opitutus sp. ER46]PTX90663.1 hypothetical protein DB354_18525 [Opitutus sp. ER46]